MLQKEEVDLINGQYIVNPNDISRCRRFNGNMERWGYVTEDKTAPVISKYPNQLKIYHLASNVEEYMQEKGIIKGGGWKDTGYYLQNFVSQTYDSTNATSEDRAFRVAMEIIK